MKVLVLHTLPPNDAGPGRSVGEFDLTAAAEGVAGALPDASIAGIRGNHPIEMIWQIGTRRPDVVFNLCEAPMGRPGLEAHAAALLEWMGVRFTGSRNETLLLCRRKDRVNALLNAAGVPVPREGVFPCIVKPADEDGSAGIHASSVCENEAQVEAQLARISGPAVVQEFLPGREFSVSLWGSPEPDFVSIGETIFRNDCRLNTYAAKWDVDSADYANSPLFYHTEIEASLRESIVDTARAAWRIMGVRGYLRVDVRLDAGGCPNVLDVNPNPELSPGAGISRAAEAAGWSWQRFVRQQVEWAR